MSEENIYKLKVYNSGTTCAVLSISNETSFEKNFQAASYKTYKSSIPGNIAKFVYQVLIKLDNSIQLYNEIHDETLSKEARKDIQRLKIDELISNTNFVQTLLNWYILFITKGLEPLNLETINILSKLCIIDNLLSGDSNSKGKLIALRIFLPTLTLDHNCIEILLEIITKTSKSSNTKSKQASIQMVQNFSVMNSFILTQEQKNEIKQMLLNLLCDDSLQIRHSACLVLTSMFHINFIKVDCDIINKFKKLSKSSLKNKSAESNSSIQNGGQFHGGILGLCAIVNSSPYEIPLYLPDIVSYLCQYSHQSEPIGGSVKKCLNEFKRTHLDNWSAHRQKFSSEQLTNLDDALLSGNYFA